MMKRTFFTEVSYVAGIIALALGTALMERADFGITVSCMVYIRHGGILSAGIADYCAGNSSAQFPDQVSFFIHNRIHLWQHA